MHKLVAWMLVPGVLSLSAIAVARAQDRGAKPNAAARAANAPPLVPVRLNVDGNFRIAPPYAADPAFTRKPDVPQGRVIRFTMNSAESNSFRRRRQDAVPDRVAAAARQRRRSPRSRRSTRHFNDKSRSTCRPATSPTRRLPSSSSRTNAGSFRKTRRRDPTANREPTSRSCRSCSTT